MAEPWTPEQLEHMQEHVDETQVPGIFISSGICVGATLIAVILRIISRRLGESGLGRDDYVLFVGFLLYLGYIIAWCYSTRFGQGRHAILITDFRAFMISNLISMSFYIFGLSCIKLSIVFLYRRIFRSQRFLYALYALAAIVIAWSLASFFSSLFACYPIQSTWDPDTEGACHNLGRLAFTLGVLNLIIDFIILAYPIPEVWRLQMSTEKKVMLITTFLAGGIACIVSFARLFFTESINSTYDRSWDGVIAGILTGLEMCTGIIACCMITFRPLLQSVRSRRSSVRSVRSMRQRWDKIVVQQDIEMSSGSSQQQEGNRQERMYSWRIRYSQKP